MTVADLFEAAKTWAALVAAVVAIGISIRKDRAESRLLPISEGKGRLELAEMIEAAAERQVKKLTTQLDDTSARLDAAEARIASLEAQVVNDAHVISSLRAYIRALLMWISSHVEGADYPKPGPDLGI